MDEIELARLKRRAEKRLRQQGLTRSLAQIAVGRMSHEQLRKTGRRSLIETLRGDK